MSDTHLHFIAGAWAEGGPARALINPATEAPAGAVAIGGAAEIERAVAAARAAFPAWAATAPGVRAQVLARLLEALEARRDRIIAVHAAEVGTPQGVGGYIHAMATIETTRTAQRLAGEYPFEEPLGSALVQKLPVGVVGAITPWNVPLQLVAAKAAPALAAGCTLVLKPSELTPGCAALFAEAAQAADLPAGVFNLVHGDAAAGEALVAHPGVDMVSFTGSAPVGRRIGSIAAGRMARLLLELGGKSASLVLDDADVADAAVKTARQVFMNSGQGCVAWSRLLVPRARLGEAVEAACAVAQGLSLGDPADPAVTLGPLISAAQRARVAEKVAKGLVEGAVLACGGPDAPVPERGWFYAPTVLSGVDNAWSVAREEIFGPVLCILPYDGEDQGVAIAEDSEYGLHGAVFSGDPARALAVARRLRTGQVSVNGGRFESGAPFGGFRQSGIGRQGGRYGLEAYLELKALHL